MKLIILLCCVAAALLWRADSFPTGDPPVFTATLEDQVVADTDASGDPASFSLQCQVTGNPTPTITWFRQGNMIEGATGATLTVNPIVTGTDATVDGVEYYCEANNSFGRIRSRRASVQLATFGVWTVSGTRTIDARLGFSVAIPCTPPTANPAPIVFWQANGTTNVPAGDPLSGSAADRVQVLPSGHLVIHALEASDFAVTQYRCSVSNARTHSTSQSPQTFTLNQVETLSTTQGQPGLRVFNHAPTEQAERGKRLYIFNVVQPTMEGNLFSFEEPSGITLRNERSYYTVENVKVTDEVLLQVTYFAREGGNSITLGSLSTQINVFDPATVTSVSGPHRILTGRSVTLACNIAAIPDATVAWYKDGIQILSGTRRSISSASDTNTRLTISSATPADNGMYQCVVSNVHGDDVGTISLQVRDHELEIVQGLARETPFLEGDNRILTVIVRSDTQPTATWSVNGQELTRSNSTYMIDSVVAGSKNDRGLTDYTISLSVFFLNTTYQGEYRLVAAVPSDGLAVETAGNVLQEMLTSNVDVEVVGSPCLVIGTDVTLRCQPDGVPRSQVTWFRNDIQLMPNDSRYRISDDPDFTITIINVVEGNAGTYTCNAMNTLTNGTVSEERRGTETFGIACVPPTIAQATDDTVVVSPMLMEGETLSLTCSAMGTPRPQVDWYRGDSRIIISSRTQINETEIGDTALLSTLVISSVVVGDSGTYECRIENIAGTTSLQYQVAVNPVQFPWWAILAIALGAVLIVCIFLVVCIVCCCVFRRSGTYEIGGKEETDNAEEEFNPLYASLPAQRPAQPPEYKQAPSYPSGTSLVRTPIHISEMDNRFASLPPPDSSSSYLPQSYSKEFYPREARHASYQDFTANDGQFV